MEHRQHRPYARLALMAALSFVAMYVLMYAMVAEWRDAYPNINQAYMAALMAAPMVVIELLLMARMYPNRRLNAMVLAGSAVVFVGAFAAIRTQAGVGDAEFLRSMIPHHSAAVLMCERAPVNDAEIERLCGRIVSGQRQEIAEMRSEMAQG
jgi:uncharacterized protein (DUF305 family)